MEEIKEVTNKRDEFLRKENTKLRKENGELKATDMNTILKYVQEAADQLDRVNQYAQEVNGQCKAICLSPDVERQYGLNHLDKGWVVAGVIEDLVQGNEELRQNGQQVIVDLTVLTKQFEAYKEKHRPKITKT